MTSDLTGFYASLGALVAMGAATLAYVLITVPANRPPAATRPDAGHQNLANLRLPPEPSPTPGKPVPPGDNEAPW